MAIEDNTKYGLTGAQIKELSTRVKLKGDKPLSGNTDPSTSTAGGVGQLYINKTAGTTFYLESISGTEQAPVYNWISVGGGSGGAQADWNTTDSAADSYIKNKPMENSVAEFTVAKVENARIVSDVSPNDLIALSGSERTALLNSLAIGGVTPGDTQDDPWLIGVGISNGYGIDTVYSWDIAYEYNASRRVDLKTVYAEDGRAWDEGSYNQATVEEKVLDNGGKIFVCRYNSGNAYGPAYVIFGSNFVITFYGSGNYNDGWGDQLLGAKMPNGIVKTLSGSLLPKATSTTEGITSLQTVTDTVASSITVGDYLKKTTVNNKPQLDIKQAFVDWEENDNTSPAYIINRPFGITPAGATVPVNDIEGAVMTSYGSGSSIPQFGAYLPVEIFDTPASSYYAYGISSDFVTFLGLSGNPYSALSYVPPFKCLGVEGYDQWGAYGSAYFPTGNKAGDELLANIQAGAQVTINYGWWYESMEQMQDVGFSTSDTVTFQSGTFENRTYCYYAFATPKAVQDTSYNNAYIYGFVVLPVLDANNVEIGWTLAVIGVIQNEQFENNSGFNSSIAISYVSALPSVQYLDAQVIPLDPNVFEINAQGQITLKTNP